MVLVSDSFRIRRGFRDAGTDGSTAKCFYEILPFQTDQVRKKFPGEVIPHLNPARQVRISQVSLDTKLFKAEEER